MAELQTEISGSVDISLTHKAIYVPIMKVATQTFQDVFRKRFKGKRIPDKQVPLYIKHHKMDLSEFFVFTFVRDPFKIFVSAYREVSKYAEHNRTAHIGFTLIPNKPEHEPKRALTCLKNIAHADFHGLIPAHMHTQLWKAHRCLGMKHSKPLNFSFVGRLEHMEEDWKYVESQLGIPHSPLHMVHSSEDGAWSHWPKHEVSKLKFDPVSSGTEYSELTRQVCKYYESDFDCFGYDDTLCHS